MNFKKTLLIIGLALAIVAIGAATGGIKQSTPKKKIYVTYVTNNPNQATIWLKGMGDKGFEFTSMVTQVIFPDFNGNGHTDGYDDHDYPSNIIIVMEK